MIDELVSQLKAGLISKEDALKKVNGMFDESMEMEPATLPAQDNSEEDVSDDGERDSFDDLDEQNEVIGGSIKNVTDPMVAGADARSSYLVKEAWGSKLEAFTNHVTSPDRNTLHTGEDNGNYDNEDMGATERLYRNAKLIEQRKHELALKYKQMEVEQTYLFSLVKIQ
jgi:hypothetical protein